MRRSDREITDRNEIIQIMEQCDVCRLAFNDEAVPYILPLNFGLHYENENITLYFHGATEGKKYELLRRDNRVSFEMDCSHQLVMDGNKGSCTMKYKSVIGRGRLEIVSEEEKYNGLCILMKQYHKEDFDFDRSVISRTTVMKLVVEEVTAKER